MFKVTICDIGKMNINMTDKIGKKEATFAVPYNGEAPSNFVKNRIVITPPSGMTVEQFDEMVIKTGNSFGNNPNITYCLEPFEQTQGNCNSSSSTLLYKAGVPLSRIKDLRKQISGLVWGFGDIKPWTVEEQSKAVQRQREFDQLRNEMMNTIILNKY